MTDSAAPLRVKFLARGHASGDHALWLRQFPGRIPRWGECVFRFDQDARDYDWLVVYDDLPPRPGERRSHRVETLACPRRHTLLVTTEPSSIKYYGRGFLAQFGYVLTSQEHWAIPHPDPIFGQSGYRWFYGVGPEGLRDYDRMVAHPPLAKTGLISTVTSAKRQRHTLHDRRHAFVQALAQRLPELERFGHGIRPVGDKAEAMDPFRYHVAIENHIAPHHWTEKLADCFLALSLPFYHGAPDAGDYFPEGSFVPVDLDDPDASARLIRETMARDHYAHHLPQLREARRRVLEEYNLFALLARVIAERHAPAATGGARGRIYGRHGFRRRHPALALEQLLVQTRWQLLARRGKAPGAGR